LEPLSFAEVLNLLDNKEENALLIGNGFSISYKKEYASITLIESIQDQTLRSIAEQTGEKYDVENIYSAIHTAKLLANILATPDTSADIVLKCTSLESKLVSEIVTKICSIDEDDYYSNDSFEKELDFVQRFSAIFSLNYDSVLYRLLFRIRFRGFADGFNREFNDYFNTWNRSLARTNLFYVHGAYFIGNLQSNRTDVLKKLIANRQSLMSYNLCTSFQNLHATMQKFYPQIVLAPNTESKRKMIQESEYLSYCYNKLTSLNRKRLVIFGWKCSPDKDKHIIEAINSSAVEEIFIGMCPDEKHLPVLGTQYFPNKRLRFFNHLGALSWSS
jgi:hypothetical protein